VSEAAPDLTLWNLVRGALGTKALAVVADLGVADALAAGPRPVADVAREVGADPDSLNRFLRALASDGVFAEVEPGVYSNNGASEPLRRGGTWHDFAHLFGGVWYRAVADAEASTGEATFPRTFGADFWSWLARNPDERASFDRAMAANKAARLDRLGRADLREGETVADVGGGNGALLVELVRLRPGLRGIVLDLPETVRDEQALARAGVEFVAGSFFDHVPVADLYLLGGILHDWDDERAGLILRTIRASAPAGARLLVFDSVLAPGNEPHGAKWLDLLMLVLARGRERTEPEWRRLLTGAGFEVDAIEDGLIQCRSS
jgi:hypothetical protein